MLNACKLSQLPPPRVTTIRSGRGHGLLNLRIITSSSISKIIYSDTDGNKRTLCNNCDSYGYYSSKLLSLKEGTNNISLIAVDNFGNIAEKNISLFIDSISPRITKILPKNKQYTNGSSFILEFIEKNVISSSIILNGTSIPITNCTNITKNMDKFTCFFNLNLNAYDSNLLSFYINISDPVRSIRSKNISINVDTTNPNITINSPIQNQDYNITKIPVNISLSEKALLQYFNNGVFRTLCNNCDSYGLFSLKTKVFPSGNNSLIIKVTDKAGNSKILNTSFSIQ